MPILLRRIWMVYEIAIAQKYGLRCVGYCALWHALWYTKIWSIAPVRHRFRADS